MDVGREEGGEEKECYQPWQIIHPYRVHGEELRWSRGDPVRYSVVVFLCWRDLPLEIAVF
jgi:hypothetical protein